MTEKWVRVTSESELRPGMVVRVKRCRQCGATEAFMFLGWQMSDCVDTDDEHPLMRVAPVDCQGSELVCMGSSACGPGAIHQGRLYRLDTGLDDQAEQEQGRRIYSPKQRERAR